MHHLTAILVLGLLMFAGCVSPAGQLNDCPEGACDGPAGKGSLVPEWGLVDAVQFQECRGGVAGLEAPFDAVRALVPPAFDLLGRTPASARLLLDAWACARVVVGDHVFKDVRSLQVTAFVSPVNRTWAVEGTHQYLLSLLVSEPAVASILGKRLPVDNATIGRSDLFIAPSIRFDAWNVKGDACELALEFQQQETPSAVSSGVFQYWAESGPFVRVESRENYAYQGSSAGASRLDGPCPLQPALGPASVHTSQAYHSLDVAWKLVEENYT